MSQVFDEKGNLVPVTVIQAGPCYVVQVKNKDSDGYDAVQVGFGEKREKNTTKPLLGHFKKVELPPLRFVREFRMEDDAEENGGKAPEVGQVINIELFQAGDHVDVIGVSKGRGFAGPIKRWHVRRGPESHGSMYHRSAGSQGASSYPSRTWKNKPAAGQMGSQRCTALNLIVIKTDKDRNLLLVRGSVPGHNNSLVMIRRTIRSKKATRLRQLRETAADRAAAAKARAVNPLKASKKGGK
jgi:large subunit ribosomal protein L3